MAEPDSRMIGSLLTRRARLTADRIAVMDGDRRLTFDALRRKAAQWAHMLEAVGLSRGDRVAVLAPNCREFCELFYGCAYGGLICCGLNHRLSASELKAIMSDCGAKILFAHSMFLELAAAIDPGSAAFGIMPLSDGSESARICAGMPEDLPERQIRADEPLALVYTSGTTGTPKGVVITHENMFWASLTIGQSVDYRFADTHLLPVPMFHVGGLSFTVHSVHAGAALAMVGKWDSRHILDIIEWDGVNHFFAVPTMLRDLLDCPAFEPGRISSVRWILSGGAPVPAALIREYAAHDIPVMQSYGATETCGPGIFVDQDHAVSKAGSIGRPFFHTDCRIVTGDGDDAKSGEVGEILLSGGHVFSGYWNNQAATDEALDGDGWYHTGDIGFRDCEGFITLVDRKKNTIITGGENVYPREIEAVLETHPAIADIAVIGIEDPRWGEVVCAVIVPVDGQRPDLDGIGEFCRNKIAGYKRPRRMVLVDELPRNATGKLLRHKLKEAIAAPERN